MKAPRLTLIDRYLLRQLAVALLAVTVGLVALIWLTQSLRFVELVVNRGLSFIVFLRLTGLLIPNFVAIILPITTFVVVQFVYQRLSSDRELTVMRAAGLSPFALARPALTQGALVTALALLLNTWIVPASFTAFRQYQWEIRNRLAAFLLQEGVFTTVSDNLTVYVRSRDPDGTLHGILIDDARQPNSHATILAESGRLLPGDDAPRVLLINGSRQEIDHQTGRLNVLTFAQNTLDLTPDRKAEDTRFRDPGELSMAELLRPDAAAPGEAVKWRVEAFRRLSTPFTVLSFTLVALVSVLTGAFRRHGGLLRPVIAIGVVVGLVALGFMINNVAARIPALMPLMWLQAIAPGVVCAVYLFQPQGWSWVPWAARG
jgi:lipopolysaccharide export system permease protein